MLWKLLYPKTAQTTFFLEIFNATLSSFGCVGNIFIMVIISQWKNLSSGAAFMASLALADLQSIVFDGFVYELFPLSGFNLTLINRWLCAILNYVSNLTTSVSIWVTALFSVDKCLAVLFPFKYKELGKPKICIIATIFANIFLAIVLSPALFVFDLNVEKNECSVSNFEFVSRFFYFKIRMPITIAAISILPISVVLICTVTTLFKLRLNMRKRRNQRESSQANVSARDRLDKEITRQMLAVCILFCVLKVSGSVIYKLNYGSEMNTVYEQAVFNLRDKINSILTTMLNGCNLFLYLIFGRKFRADFKRLFWKSENE